MKSILQKLLAGFSISFFLTIIFVLLDNNQLPNYVAIALVGVILFAGIVVYLKKNSVTTSNANLEMKTPESNSESEEHVQLSSQMVGRLYRYRRLFAISIGILTVFIVGFHIYRLINAKTPVGSKIWQSAAFFFGLGGAWIYYIYNLDEFKTVADRVTFFSGFALGPPTVVGFII